MREKQGAGPPAMEHEWFEAAQAGDVDAFGRIYDLHVRSVFRYAASMTGNAADAEDITQDVFTLAWSKRADILVIDASMLPWLLVSAKNLSLNRIRQRSKSSPLSDDDSELVDDKPAPDEAAARRQLAVMIQSAVDELSPTDQQLYRLCLEDGRSYQEAATALGTTHGVVRNRLTRLRRTLRGNLAPRTEGLL